MLKIETSGDRRAFAPGETVAGEASWHLAEPARRVELRLFWYTRGKGTQDVGVVEVVPFEDPGEEDARPFSVTIPDGPYSLSGQLISLVWALEVVVEPGGETERVDLIVSPTREAVAVDALADETRSVRDRIEGFIKRTAHR